MVVTEIVSPHCTATPWTLVFRLLPICLVGRTRLAAKPYVVVRSNELSVARRNGAPTNTPITTIHHASMASWRAGRRRPSRGALVVTQLVHRSTQLLSGSPVRRHCRSKHLENQCADRKKCSAPCMNEHIWSDHNAGWPYFTHVKFLKSLFFYTIRVERTENNFHLKQTYPPLTKAPPASTAHLCWNDENVF
jgi:hypothetical protein